MLTKKQCLFCAYLLKKSPSSATEKEQPIFSLTHIDRLWECIRKLKSYNMIKVKEINGNPHFSLTLKGHLLTPIFIGFGISNGDKGFESYKNNAIF